ncbi:MAG: hypothetical protein F4162_03245 [Synechococcus sp. SB0676_bin_10]|uniref:Uncharacterized protein n=1 Tax=Synechococcus sp. SB0676_bin_10 TaxID=2604869 RepID=A0A6B1F4U4_9SYNE|nr:hypothetical protein [Cyanobacteria bacterium MAG IRC3_bin_20]MXY18970.1 hypothetical protein [Synechococcus sp. SB0664_bin_36]MYG38021.1 hypothetical protein [Synechococcus sp. SB0676_bin_10]MYK07932.1 hypothetical protein [Synechococcus sp. SB0670_bin_20]
MTSQSSYVPSFLLAIAMSLTATVGAQEASSASLDDQAALFTRCSRMRTVIDVQKNRIALGQSVPTQDAVRRAVTSRLRSARLFNDQEEDLFLHVHVHVVGPAFSIGVELNKRLTDELYSGLSFLAPSWQTSSTGTSGNGSSYIISSLGQALDRFIDEYLRVNEKNC